MATKGRQISVQKFVPLGRAFLLDSWFDICWHLIKH